jgi:FHA domain
MEAHDVGRSPQPVYEEIEQTQDYCEPNDMTMQVPSPTHFEEKPRSNIWGSLRRRGGDQEEIRLEHRNKDGKRDTYVIGRSRAADITVDDKRVSSQHCMVYCDYEEARLRVFVEDTSVNGTFVNDSLTRLHKGKRLELKTGDEIFLINALRSYTSTYAIDYLCREPSPQVGCNKHQKPNSPALPASMLKISML